ncbi:hypothetical protein HanIR_Chr11g0547631 [Helianthus annuus]|nr:hypothetical protein HanIR_Chr11g0547631 [Helianthus annuus]
MVCRTISSFTVLSGSNGTSSCICSLALSLRSSSLSTSRVSSASSSQPYTDISSFN